MFSNEELQEIHQSESEQAIPASLKTWEAAPLGIFFMTGRSAIFEGSSAPAPLPLKPIRTHQSKQKLPKTDANKRIS